MHVKRFEQNQNGIDYVVGDIHGEFTMLESCLSQHGFNPEKDRLFSVGDLVDRGTHSVDALKWLGYPWFHACRGNHEHFVLLADTPEFDMQAWYMHYGGIWWRYLTDERKQAFKTQLSVLPIVMEVAVEKGRVGIVHADVPKGTGWDEFITQVEVKDTKAIHTALWGRSRATGQFKKGVPGIDRVYCGHTANPDGKVHKVDNVWFIDTGACYRGEHTKLTVLPLTGFRV